MSSPYPYDQDYLNKHLNNWNIIRLFDDIPSTNTYLKDNALLLADRSIILANQQSAGRGRYQRNFLSAKDKGIYCSFIIKNDTHCSLTQISFATAIALASSIYHLYKIRVQVKWPNDLVYANQKLAGILIETTSQEKALDIVIGFGLNVYSQDFGELSAIALEDIQSHVINRNELLVSFFKIFDQMLLNENIIEEYRAWMVPSGTPISTSIQGIKSEVSVLDVQDDGSLLVKKHDGTYLKLFNEEIQIITTL